MPNDAADFDPIALLQALGSAAPVEATQESGAAPDDLFAGSEPVDVQAATVAAQVAQVAAPAPPAEPTPEPAVANLSQDGVIRLLQEALLALHERVAAIERHATRNGWPL